MIAASTLSVAPSATLPHGVVGRSHSHSLIHSGCGHGSPGFRPTRSLSAGPVANVVGVKAGTAVENCQVGQPVQAPSSSSRNTSTHHWVVLGARLQVAIEPFNRPRPVASLEALLVAWHAGRGRQPPPRRLGVASFSADAAPALERLASRALPCPVQIPISGCGVRRCPACVNDRPGGPLAPRVGEDAGIGGCVVGASPLAYTS